MSEEDLAPNPSFPPTTQCQATIYLKEIWQSLCPPVEEVEIVGRWYARTGKRKRVTKKADDDSFQIQEEVISESEKESSDNDASEEDLAPNPPFPPTTQHQAAIYLKEFWQSLCPPVEEVEIVGKWYARTGKRRRVTKKAEGR